MPIVRHPNRWWKFCISANEKKKNFYRAMLLLCIQFESIETWYSSKRFYCRIILVICSKIYIRKFLKLISTEALEFNSFNNFSCLILRHFVSKNIRKCSKQFST